jgi:hypothetical protein
MRNNLLYIVSLLIVFGQFACQKIIEVELAEGDRQLVVEAVGSSFDAESYVLLSKTVASTQAASKEIIPGGIVSITDKDGVVYEFTEVEPGRFENDAFKVTPNNTYSFSAAIDGKVLTSTAVTQSTPEIDSISYLTQIGDFFGDGTDTSYFAFYNFVDNAEEENYYQIKIWINGDLDNNFYLTDDKLSNGGLISAPFFGAFIEPKDSIYVELLSMDEANYLYLTTLDLNLQQSAFAAAPANPVSNVENGIGYFGVYTKDSLSFVFP